MRGSIPVGHRTIVTTFQPGLGTFFDKARVGLNAAQEHRAWLWVVACMLSRSVLVLMAPGEALSMHECMSVAHRPIMTTLLLTSGTYFHGAVVALNVQRGPGMAVGGRVHAFAVCACVDGPRGGAQHA